jgi:hypothetical protein
MLFVYSGNIVGGYVGDGYSGKAFHLDDNVTVVFKSFDYSLYTGKNAFGNKNAAANLINVVPRL